MPRHRPTLLMLLAALAGCSSLRGDLDGAPNPRGNSTLSIRADYLNITGRDLTMMAGDSLVIRATVDGEPEAYNLPTVSATDTSAVRTLGDGALIVRRPAPLNLTATATPKPAFSGRPTLTATGKLTLSCTMDARAGLNVSVRDFVSGQAPSGTGTMRFHSSTTGYADSLTVPTRIANWNTAWEHAGSYTVSIDADGYQPWTRDGITVRKGLCHVMPVSVRAEMLPK